MKLPVQAKAGVLAAGGGAWGLGLGLGLVSSKLLSAAAQCIMEKVPLSFLHNLFPLLVYV